MKSSFQALFNLIASPITLGVIAFLAVVGPYALIPSNLAWIQSQDPLQHYLGWTFFRHGPWFFQWGLNPNFGLEIGSAIVYSDSIPIFAFLFKLFNRFLGEPFQYFGIWVLLCFMLQAWFASLVAGLLTKNRLLIYCMSGILVFTPMMFWRIGEHAALVGQFLILFALYLNLRKTQKHRIVYWALLLAFAVLIHSYLFVMVLMLWLTDLGDKGINLRTVAWQVIFIEFILVLGLILIVMWFEGYFVLNTSSFSNSERYGGLGIDFLSLFDSRGWSYILPPISSANHSYEGYIYMGLGTILILPFVLYGLVRQRFSWLLILKQHIFLAIFCLSATLFALTHNFTLGTWVYQFPLPISLLDMASILRMSARFFWPVFYLIEIFCFFVLIRTYSQPKVVAILVSAFLIQAIDTSAGWINIRKAMMRSPISQFDTPLKNPFWTKVAKHYTKLELGYLTDWVWQPHWSTWSNYAALHKMTTNAVYLSRVDSQKILDSNEKRQKLFMSGQFDPKTLYIFDDRFVLAVLPYINRSTEYFARIDGFNVLAPNLKSCNSCELSEEEKKVIPSMPITKLGEGMAFKKYAKPELFLQWGWSNPEGWGTWSEGEVANLVLPMPEQKAQKIIFTANAFLSQNHPSQEILVQVNKGPIQHFKLNLASNNTIEVAIPNELTKANLIEIQFQFKNAFSPKSIGMNSDQRKLAIGLISARFE